MYAQVAVDRGSANLDFFTYRIPEHLTGLIERGACVLVPLSTQVCVGFVVGLQKTPDVQKVRDILHVVEPPAALSPDLIELAEWISSRWICGLQRTLLSVVPRIMNYRMRIRIELISPKFTKFPYKKHADSGREADGRERIGPSLSKMIKALAAGGGSALLDDLKKELPTIDVSRAAGELERRGLARRCFFLDLPRAKPRLVRAVEMAMDTDGAVRDLEKLTPRQARVMEICRSSSPIEVEELIRRAGVGRSVITALESKGLLRPTRIVKERSPSYTHWEARQFELTDEQTAAIQAIREPLECAEHTTLLLHGVTASGKTEVYLRAIEEALRLGRNCLVLVPEISLTTQLTDIFKSRFGHEAAVLHSGLRPGERFDEWMRVQSGQARIAIGPRSALFAPLKNLGLAIVDEEHEPAFKQETDPRYHAREAVIHRAKQTGATVVLGSATPSVESYYRALKGEFRLIQMKGRVEKKPQPEVMVADLRPQYREGRFSIFSPLLQEAIEERLGRREQVILFQNRRAYSTLLLCRECGFVSRCPNCAVSLKLHSAEQKLKCHHCAYETRAPTVCPNCEGRRIGRFGIGTERVEEQARLTFPGARVLRMDRDTTSTTGAHGRILGAFRRGEADILVGTQMIAKGLDFPNVTLVGVISADTALNLPDFRAAERTFQLLSQVAGRAGRGQKPGQVIIQTFAPEHYAVQCSVSHNYEEFYCCEIAAREELGYPPFSSIIHLVTSEESESAASARMRKLATRLIEMKLKKTEILGPSPAPIPRLRGKHRWHLVLRSQEREELLGVLRSVFTENQEMRRRLVVDVDPVSML